jgi:predicted ATPase
MGRQARWPTTFLGRARELERVHELFAGGGENREWLVTLVGAAGTGKTRLASRFAELRGPDLAGGSWFCDLTEARDRSGVCSALGRALDVTLTKNPVAALGSALAERGELLVVLDNCEQVADEVAAAVAEWHDAAPAACFLATSRELLHVRGERVYELPPLSESEAIDLFVDRASRVRDGYALTEVEAPLVTRIIRAVDGLPLAIELSAARLRLLSTAQILERLGIDLLSDGPRDVTARQKTLRGAIDWSWNLLDETERSALAQCSVFRGGFTAELAEAVLEVDGDVLGALAALRDKSLIRAQAGESGDVRLSLYESIREYAAEKLAASGKEDACIARFSAACLAYAERLDPDESSARLFAEQENLALVHTRAIERRARSDALRAIVVLEPVYHRRGPFDVFLAMVDEGIALGGSSPAERSLLARVHLVRCGARMRHARLEEAIDDAERALGLARDAGDRGVLGRAHMMRGAADSERGDEARALEHFTSALAVYREIGDTRQEMICLANIGMVHHRFGRLEKAVDHYERGIAGMREAGERPDVFIGNLALANQELGRWDEARRCCEDAIAGLGARGDRFSVAVLRGYLGAMEHERGNLDAARRLYDRAIESLRAVRAPSFAALFVGARAAVLAALGELDAAESGFDQAEAELRAIADPGTLLAVQIHRGHLDLARGDPRAARDRLALAPLEGRPSDDVRFAFRTLERAIAASPASDPKEAPALTVGTGGSWFVAPGTTAVVELSKRQHLRRLLAALAQHRLKTPDRVLDVETLFERGWPGERALPRARASRVHVALTTLRKAGLRDLLLHKDGGYMLDPSVPLVFASERR